MDITTTKSTIVVDVVPAFGEVKSLKKLHPGGNCLDIKRKPHVIDVVFDAGIPPN